MEVLDGAFALVKATPAMVAAAAVAMVPLHVLSTWLASDALGEGISLDLYGEGSTSSGGSGGAVGSTVVSLLGFSLITTLLVAVAAVVVTAPTETIEPSASLSSNRGPLRAVAASGPGLLGVWALVHVAEGLATVAFLVGALAPMTWFFVAAPALVVEGIGPVAALRRSARLVNRRFWPTVGFGLLVVVVGFLFDQAVGTLSTVVALVPATERYTWVPTLVTGVLSGILLSPVVAAAATGWYLDLRVRTEGLDLALEADRLLGPR